VSAPEDPAGTPKPSHLVEAVLLASAHPVGVGALSSATGLPEEEVGSALLDLARRYSPKASGILLRNLAGGYLLSTNPTCAPAVERLRDEARATPLSGAAYEVLSCALYHGPLTRSAISGVRGVNSDAVVRSLIERGLLAEVGADREAPGSPALLDVTEEFLVAAGASSRKDFPPLETLVGDEELARLRERLRAVGESPPGESPSAQPPETP
jgi:segregation and condensation protein B